MLPNTELNGFLLIDKPAGWTSFDVVAKVRGILKIKRIGHAGTLDPFATGLVILGIGKGTKRLESLMHQPKTYETTIRLGLVSTTFDTEGEISEPPYPLLRGGDLPTQLEIEKALDQFRGGYEQRAPLFSAKQIHGKRLYDLAREGKATEEMRPTKHVSIDEITLLNYTYPLLTLRVTCGSGTYIRSLADDIGRELGTGGYCESLRRISGGGFKVEQAIAPTQDKDTLIDKLITI